MSVHNFSWLDASQTVAGMARPCALEDDLRQLRTLGIGAIVGLTLSPLDAQALREAGMDYLHLPLPDFSAPSISEIEQAVRFIREKVDADDKVVVHCAAGMGRTGTMLACYLVATGKTSDAAIEGVRKARPGSIETYEQEQAVRQYAEHLMRSGRPARKKKRNPRRPSHSD